MKNSSWRFGGLALFVAMACFARQPVAIAADENSAGPAERLEKLEQRIGEMSQRQEQLMRRFGALPERPQAGPGMAGREASRPIPPVSEAPASMPPSAKFLKDIAGAVQLCLLVGFLFNILIAVWIFSDIRKRGEGSGVFVALALLAGVPAGIIYSLVRIGDRKLQGS